MQSEFDQLFESQNYSIDDFKLTDCYAGEFCVYCQKIIQDKPAYISELKCMCGRFKYIHICEECYRKYVLINLNIFEKKLIDDLYKTDKSNIILNLELNYIRS